MATVGKQQINNALDKLLSVPERCKNMRSDCKKDILECVSTINNIFLQMENPLEQEK